MSVGDPGKWQAQYRDREMNLWFDIGDAQQDRADAQAREQEYADRHAAITGNAQRTKECDGCGGVHPVSTLHHERLVDMGSSESDYRCRVCGPLNHQRITSPTAARLAELPEALMAPDLVEAYRAVARDLGARSERAQKDARPRRQFIQSLENARAVVLREAGIEDAL